jgi:hypothetical protein
VEFEYRYLGSSAVDSSAKSTNMSFAPDTKREPTYFRGELHQNLEFREAISALNAVVVSDLRYKPKDKTAYKAWLAQQEHTRPARSTSITCTRRTSTRGSCSTR